MLPYFLKIKIKTLKSISLKLLLLRFNYYSTVFSFDIKIPIFLQPILPILFLAKSKFNKLKLKFYNRFNELSSVILFYFN